MPTAAPSIGPSPLQSVYSTIDAAEIRKIIENTYTVGQVKECLLLQCGFNDVYEVSLSDGRRCIARLSSRRERGVPNVDYETALLRHLKRSGAAVAEPWVTKNDALFVSLSAAEGERSLVVFEYLAGKSPGDNHSAFAPSP